MQRVICEMVAFRYSDEQSLMLVGEAEITLEVMDVQNLEGESLANIQSVRVDLLSIYDAAGQDQYTAVMADQALKKILEDTALDHYLRPPRVPVELPRRIVEW